MSAVDIVKERLKTLYEENPHVHINIYGENLIGESVKITGLYPNLFMIEGENGSRIRKKSLSYNEIAISSVVIEELDI